MRQSRPDMARAKPGFCSIKPAFTQGPLIEVKFECKLELPFEVLHLARYFTSQFFKCSSFLTIVFPKESKNKIWLIRHPTILKVFVLCETSSLNACTFSNRRHSHPKKPTRKADRVYLLSNLLQQEALHLVYHSSRQIIYSSQQIEARGSK